MLQGEGFHRDNAGNDEIIKAGGVQWMFAGSGIMHSEGPTKHMLENGGVQEFIQLWINAPKAKKGDKPFYQSATAGELPHVMMSDGVDFRLASGTYAGKEGPIRQFTPIVSMIGEIAAGKKAEFKTSPGYWTLVYVVKGSVVVNDHTSVEALHLIVFEKDNDSITIAADTGAQLLFLSAEPLDEPVAAKDNFVMNTEEEIRQALADARSGAFGTLSY